MSERDKWEARKAAALSTINQLRRERQRMANHAKCSVVYMEACGVPEDVHPAIGIVESEHFRSSAADGQYHSKLLTRLNDAAAAIEAMTYEGTE